MTRSFILAAAATAATVVAVAPAAAQQWRWNERGWRTIGYTRVDGRDSDRINLPGYTRQRAIRLCAMNAPLRLRDFDVRSRLTEVAMACPMAVPSPFSPTCARSRMSCATSRS